MEEKVFIFISHSHKDLDKVRKVRNFLEKNCSEPILFFLKSRDDEDEITSLIKDEIDARIWFIYCDSKNARESRWVKKELDYVYETGKRNCTTIDLDSDFDSRGYLKEKTKRKLKKELKIFLYLQKLYISYSHHDFEVVKRVRDVLGKYEIVTMLVNELVASSDWIEGTNAAIDRSSALLYFLSDNSVNSFSSEIELKRAKENNKDVFVIYLDNRSTMLRSTIQYDYTIDVSTPESIEKGAVGLVYYLFDHIS